jgi:hypothetical protein
VAIMLARPSALATEFVWRWLSSTSRRFPAEPYPLTNEAILTRLEKRFSSGLYFTTQIRTISRQAALQGLGRDALHLRHDPNRLPLYRAEIREPAGIAWLRGQVVRQPAGTLASTRQHRAARVTGRAGLG